MAATVLSLAVVAVTQSLVSGQMASYAALHEARATSLAEALAEEIIAKSYLDPDGGPAGEFGRATWDNIEDFNGYTEAAGAVADVAGNVYGGVYAQFSRSVTVAAATMTLDGFATPTNGLNVTVTVTDGDGRAWQITRFVPES